MIHTGTIGRLLGSYKGRRRPPDGRELFIFVDASHNWRSGGLIAGARRRGELRSLLLRFFLFATVRIFVSHAWKSATTSEGWREGIRGRHERRLCGFCPRLKLLRGLCGLTASGNDQCGCKAADRCLAALIRWVIERIASKIWIFHCSPIECFSAVGKCAHLDRPAVADSINIRQPHLIPFVTTLGASPHVNEHDNAVSRSDKPLWFRCFPRPRRNVIVPDSAHGFTPVVSASAWGIPPVRSIRSARRMALRSHRRLLD